MPHPPAPCVRRARLDDAPRVVNLLSDPAERGLLLPRPLDDVRSHIANFMLAEQGGTLAGCVAVRDFETGLFEVRSLAVHPEHQGRGIGSWLTRAAVEHARGLAATSVFVLTYRPGLFERQGFVRVPKDMFPQKVWDDCAKCHKRDHCDEAALVLHT